MLKPFFLMLAMGGFTITSVLAQDPMGNEIYEQPATNLDTDNSIMPEDHERIIEGSSDADDTLPFDDVTLEDVETVTVIDKPEIFLEPEEYIDNYNVDQTTQIVVQD